MDNNEPKKRGRPRIEDVQLRDAAPSSPLPAPKTEAPPMKNKAYSIVQMGNNWMLVKVAFNPLSGHAGTPELTLIGNNYMEAEEKLKATIAVELLR